MEIPFESVEELEEQLRRLDIPRLSRVIDDAVDQLPSPPRAEGLREPASAPRDLGVGAPR